MLNDFWGYFIRIDFRIRNDEGQIKFINHSDKSLVEINEKSVIIEGLFVKFVGFIPSELNK